MYFSLFSETIFINKFSLCPRFCERGWSMIESGRRRRGDRVKRGGEYYFCLYGRCARVSAPGRASFVTHIREKGVKAKRGREGRRLNQHPSTLWRDNCVYLRLFRINSDFCSINCANTCTPNCPLTLSFQTVKIQLTFSLIPVVIIFTFQGDGLLTYPTRSYSSLEIFSKLHSLFQIH